MARQPYQRVCLFVSLSLFSFGLLYGDKVTILKEPTKGEKWIWQTNSPWQVIKSTYTKCTIGSEDLNYIGTPFIKMPPRVRSIYVTIVYSVKSCNGKEKCSEEFVLKKLEVNESLLHGEIKPERFNDTVKTIRNTNPNNTITAVIPVTVKAGGVYFALVDKSTCQTLFSFEVSYKVCPKEGANLLVFDDTPVPASGSQKTVASGRCVRNSVLAPNASSPKAVCGSNEKWIVDSNLSCFCNPGYQPSTDLKLCLECPQGSYKESIGNEQCRNCSSNSAPNKNRTTCLCLENYFQVPGESNCTGKPSAPEKLNITSLSESNVTLVWKEPNDTGGRNDVVYGVNCMVYTSFKWEKCPSTVGYNPKNESLKEMKVILSNLQPYTQYKIIISATNGVSKLLSDTNPASKEKVLKTAESIPGEVSKIKCRWLNKQTVNVKWNLDDKNKNGKILQYKLRYYQKNKMTETEKVINATKNNINITGLSSEKVYVFEIRARTKVGFGEPASKESEPIKPSSAPPSQPTLNDIALIVGSCAAAGVMFLIICCAVMYLRRRKIIYKPGNLDGPRDMVPLRTYVDPGEYGDLFVALKNFTREIDRTLVTLEKLIGGGEFGDVYKGSLKAEKHSESKSETVALKILKSGASRKSRDDFLTEASIMGQFKHENVLEMKGVISSPPIMIVLEFMENGALNNFLKQHDGQLSTIELLGMARDVAKGMAYLSEMNFIHRDLSARNILVSEDRVCKVADFGLSREIAEDNPESEYLTQGGKIPVRWTALEAFKFRKFSSSSDVWSFGVLTWEIMSFGERPYWQWDNYEVMNQVERGYRLPAPMDCPKAIHKMMKECWRENRTQRPKFEDLAQFLDKMITSPELLNDDMADQVNFKRSSINFEEIRNVDEWLDQINLAVYKPNFMEAGLINLGHVIDIDDNMLKVLGVDVIGHRNRIKRSVKTMKDFLNENAEEGEI